MKLLVALFVYSSRAYPADLGVIGKTYSIDETDFIDFMKEKAANKASQINKKWEQMTDRAKNYLNRPPGIKLPRAQKYKVSAYNPSLTLSQDITNENGHILLSKGTTINPLLVKGMSRFLCFIDADDQQQVRWAKRYCLDPMTAKMILANGPFLETSKALKTRIYFDHNAKLIKRFSIQHLPALVRQQGSFLYVEEFPVSGEK